MFSTLRLLNQSARNAFHLTMYTGTDCQLCELMRHQIHLAARTLPIHLHTYNIRDDALPHVHHWRRKYQYDIPVLHLDGKEIFRHRLKAADLVAVLQQSEAE